MDSALVATPLAATLPVAMPLVVTPPVAKLPVAMPLAATPLVGIPHAVKLPVAAVAGAAALRWIQAPSR